MAENPFLDALDKFRGAPRKSRLSAAFAPTPEAEPEDSEENKASLLRRVGEATAGAGLGFAGAVGNALDLPGSMVRDVVHGVQKGQFINPLDQLLSPFGDQNRTTGRDINREAGMASHEDTTGNWWGGVGTEMLLDPLTYVTGPFAKSLSKGGSALKAADLAGDMTKVAAKRLGRSWGKVGPRMAALSSTANDILSAIDDPVTKAAKTAEVEAHLAKKGTSLAAEGDKAAGGLFGVGMPYVPWLSSGDPLFTFGSGPKSKVVGDTLDTLFRGIQHAKIPGTNLAPLNELARLFDPTIKEASSVEGQAMGREAYQHAPANEATSGLAAAELAQGLNKAGLGDEQADFVRAAAEQRNAGGTWKEIGPNDPVPVGSKVRMNVSTGQKHLWVPLFGPNRAKIAAELAQALPGEAPERHAAMLAGWDNKAMTWAAEQGKSPDDWYARTFAEIRDQSQAHRVGSGAMPQEGAARSWSDILDSNLKQAPLNISPTGKLAESSVKGNDLQTRLRKIYSAMHKYEGNPNAQAKLRGMAEQTINQLEDMGEKPLWTAELSPTMKQEGGPNVLFQEGNQQGGFYSKLARVVDEKVGGKTTWDQLQKTLKNNGVTDEEIADTGIEQLFKANSGIATKKMIQQHVAEHGLELKHDILGEPQWPEVVSREKLPDGGGIMKLRNGDYEMELRVVPRGEKSGVLEPVYDILGTSPQSGVNAWTPLRRGVARADLDAATRDIVLNNPRLGGDNTAFKGFTVPGGDPGSYREHVFTLPAKENPELDAAKAALKEAEGRASTTWSNDLGRQRDISYWQQQVDKLKNTNYEDGHFGITNQATHVRTDVVTMPDGKKILRINEIQDDWAQAGRQRGFGEAGSDAWVKREGAAFEAWHSAEKEMKAAKEAVQRLDIETAEKYWGKQIPEELSDRMRALEAAADEAERKEVELFDAYQASKETPLPDRPLKEGWVKHGLRRMIDYAIKQGYDGVGIVKGADIAKAVGGPEEELGKFYDEIVANELKGLTKAKPYTHSVGHAFDSGRGHGAVKIGEHPMQVFDLSKIRDKVKTEGQPLYQANLPSGAKGAAEFVQHQGVRKAILTMLGGADTTTGIHEGGHAVENVLKEMGPDLYEKAAKAVGATDPTGKPLPVGSWPRGASEDFARQLERYHFDGTVPSPELERPFKALSDAMREVYKQTAGTPIAKDVDPLLKFVFDEAYSRGSRKLGGAWHALNTGGKQALEKFYQGVEQLRLEKQDWGTGGAELSDPTLAYVHRQMTEGTSVAGGKPSQPFTAKSRTKLPREGYLTEIEGGTATINRMSRDAELGKLIDGGASSNDVEKYLKKTYGHLASETYKEGKQVKDRWKAMAGTIAKMTPEERSHGLFGNHMAADAQAGYRSALDSHTMGKTIIVGLAQPGVIQGVNNAARVSDKSVKLRSLFKEVGLTAGDEKAGAVKKLLEHMRPQDMQALLGTTTIDAAAIRKASHLRVDAELAADLMRMSQGVTGPDAANAIIRAIDSFSNLWKGWNTGLWPKFHTRNLFSGQVNNFMDGMFSHEALGNATTMLHGGVVTGAAEMPYLKQLAAQRGITRLDDKAATELLGELAYAYKAAGKYDAAGTVTSHLDEVQPATMQEMLNGMPGGQSMNWAKTGRKLAGDTLTGLAGGKKEGTHWRSVTGLRGVGGATKSTFAPAAAGEDVGYAVEFLNRMSPLIYLLKQGWDPGAAMQKINNAQVAYGARHFTKFENGTMARIVPFYKFGRKMLPWVLNELAEHPGGRLAQVIRLQHRSHSADEMTPDYIADTMSLPVGKSLDGGRRYVTGLGLMHEDPLQIGGALLSGDLRGAGLEAASRLNPAIKGPLEYITGQTFFQKGPQGGRPLEDLDPNLGRLLANVSGRKDAVRFPGSEIAELLLSNSPASSALTQARMLTDPRKSAAVKALKATSGIGIADISEAQEEGIYRQRLQAEMKRMGSKKFLHTYFPKDKLATMSPGDRAFADWLLGEQTRLASNQKARSKEKAQ